MQGGAQVTHADNVEGALKVLRSGRGADLLMVEVHLDIAGLIGKLQDERVHVPVVACGVETDAQAAVSAIRAGAKEYIPLTARSGDDRCRASRGGAGAGRPHLPRRGDGECRQAGRAGCAV